MLQHKDDRTWHHNSDCMDRIFLVALLEDRTGNNHLRLSVQLYLFHIPEYVTKRRYIFLLEKSLITKDGLCRRNNVFPHGL